MHSGHTGTSLGGRIEISPARAKRTANGRRRQEREWSERRPSWEREPDQESAEPKLGDQPAVKERDCG